MPCTAWNPIHLCVASLRTWSVYCSWEVDVFVCLCVCYWKKISDPLRTCSVTVTLMFTVGRGRWRELSRERLRAAGEESSHTLAQISWSDTVQVFQGPVRQNQSFNAPRTQLGGLGGAFKISWNVVVVECNYFLFFCFVLLCTSQNTLSLLSVCS